jgi:hypothetical protein
MSAQRAVSGSSMQRSDGSRSMRVDGRVLEVHESFHSRGFRKFTTTGFEGLRFRGFRRLRVRLTGASAERDSAIGTAVRASPTPTARAPSGSTSVGQYCFDSRRGFARLLCEPLRDSFERCSRRWERLRVLAHVALPVAVRHVVAESRRCPLRKSGYELQQHHRRTVVNADAAVGVSLHEQRPAKAEVLPGAGFVSLELDSVDQQAPRSLPRSLAAPPPAPSASSLPGSPAALPRDSRNYRSEGPFAPPPEGVRSFSFASGLAKNSLRVTSSTGLPFVVV